MDYSKIVYNSFITDRQFVSDYFVSECKKAERDEFIKPEMFFAGCFEVCEKLKVEIISNYAELMSMNIKIINDDGSKREYECDLNEIDVHFMGLPINNKRINLITDAIEIAKKEINKTPDKPQQNNLESTELKHGKNMNLDLLDYLFIPAMTRGNKPTKLDRLKEDLRTNVCIYKAYKITALADFIYNNKTLHKNTKPKNFTDWLKQFCEIIDYPEITTYKPSSKLVQRELNNIKNSYYYFIP